MKVRPRKHRKCLSDEPLNPASQRKECDIGPRALAGWQLPGYKVWTVMPVGGGHLGKSYPKPKLSICWGHKQSRVMTEISLCF